MLVSLAPVVLALAGQSGQMVDGWRISRTETACVARITFADDTRMSVALSHRGSRLSDISLWNDRWGSIGRNQAYTIGVRFDGAPEQRFPAEGMRTDTSGGIFIKTGDAATIGKVMSARSIAFSNGARLIGSYELRGARSAMLAVARCVAGDTSNDPFAD